MNELRTKIVATIGPSTLDPETFRHLVDTGIDYVRINTSYGDFKQYDTILNNLRQSEDTHINVIYDIKHIDKLDYALENGIRHIALSFVESIDQINAVRARMSDAFVISKIESQAGVLNFDAILSASDGIMVARGDLAYSVSLEKVPPLQKEFTEKTIHAKKFLITATEMLLSMAQNPQPTRAEVSDVANAVFERSSAVMLSEETAIGSYPVEAVAMMRKIIYEAEQWMEKHETS